MTPAISPAVPDALGTAAPRRVRHSAGREVALAVLVAVFLVPTAGTLLLRPLLKNPGTLALVELFAAMSVAALAAAVPLLVLLRRRVLRPLDALHHAAERVERGEWEARVRVSSHADDALGELGSALNRVLDVMAGDRARLREVAARAFRAQESERMRIARELQEETAQQLAGVLLGLQVARRTRDDAAREALLDEVRTTLAEATDTVRRYARGLHPPALRDLGVAAAVESYARALTDASGMRISVESDDLAGALTADRELALFRIVQEALANAVRHSGAARVRVELRRSGATVHVSVSDDGVGFRLGEREAHHPCLGLFGIRERALYAGGAARVESIPSAGTTVVVEVPAGADGDSERRWPPIVAPEPATERVWPASMALRTGAGWAVAAEA